MITTVLIDVDNTILDFSQCAKSSIKKAFFDYGLCFSNAVMPAFHRINNSLWQKLENGDITKDDLYSVRFNLIFKELQIDLDGVEFERKFRSNLFTSCDPVEGAYDFLCYLSKKYILCTASNSSYSQQKSRLEKAGMLKFFKHIFVSEDIGFSKPNVNFFSECHKRLGNIPKSELIMIGDSQTADILGAKEFGIKCCWFNYKGTDEKSGADYQINSLSEIKNFL